MLLRHGSWSYHVNKALPQPNTKTRTMPWISVLLTPFGVADFDITEPATGTSLCVSVSNGFRLVCQPDLLRAYLPSLRQVSSSASLRPLFLLNGLNVLIPTPRFALLCCCLRPRPQLWGVFEFTRETRFPVSSQPSSFLPLLRPRQSP